VTWRRPFPERRQQREHDLDEEIRAHLNLAAQDRIRNGETPDHAALAARREFGNPTLIKEMAREVWGWTWLESLIQDVRYAIRTLRRAPAFTATAITALALGIGANTAIFSLVDTFLLRPLSAPDPDRIVVFSNVAGDELDVASPAKFNVWRRQTGLFEDVTAYQNDRVVNLTGVAWPERIREMRASSRFFRLFGIRIALGRTFAAEEDLPAGGHVAILSDAFWKKHFGGDAAIIGNTISLSGVSHRVIGVRAAPVRSPEVVNPVPDVYVPYQIDPDSTDVGDSLRVAARLKPGITLEMARAQLKPIGEDFRRRFPAALDAKESFGAQRLKDDLYGDIATGLAIFQGVVALVLLIACANVANLLLVRASTRKREIAVRAALGAARSRIVRQLLTESVVLSAAGSALGLLLGITGIRAIMAASPYFNPGLPVTADWRVLAFTLAVCVATGILFGFIPAIQTSGADLSAAIRESGGRSGTGLRHNRTRALLALSEMTLALVLLIGAGLLIRSFLALRSVKPGFETHNVAMIQMSLTGPRFEKTRAVAEVVHEGMARSSAVPGVSSVAATSCPPIDCTADLPFIVAGRPLNGPSHGDTYWAPVSAGYFDVLRIPLVRGRVFTDRDDGGAAPVVIINQTMARKYWPNADPFADRLILGKGLGPKYDDPPRQIVGIVGDVRSNSLDEAPKPAVYIPVAQVSDVFNAAFAEESALTWIVRTRGEPQSLSGPIQKALRDATGGLPAGEIRMMNETIARSISDHDFSALLLTIFGAVALLLAAIGIYGLMAYSVQQQTQEIGIRLALGAQSGSVRNRIVFQGMGVTLGGAVLGIAAAFALARVLSSELYGVQPWDPMVFALAPVLLCAVALAAVWFPALRASRIDPMDAIRHE
jgi:putative ABC transport system permease protein